MNLDTKKTFNKKDDLLAQSIVEWHDAELEPPEPGERVIVTDGYCSFEAYQNKHRVWMRNGMEFWFYKPTLWTSMPIPKRSINY